MFHWFVYFVSHKAIRGQTSYNKKHFTYDFMINNMLPFVQLCVGQTVINSACPVTILLTCFLVCVGLYPGCMCCFLFFSPLSVSVFLSVLYFEYDSIVNIKGPFKNMSHFLYQI